MKTLNTMEVAYMYIYPDIYIYIYIYRVSFTTPVWVNGRTQEVTVPCSFHQALAVWWFCSILGALAAAGSLTDGRLCGSRRLKAQNLLGTSRCMATWSNKLVKRNRKSVQKPLAMCHWLALPNSKHSTTAWSEMCEFPDLDASMIINVQPRLEQLQWQQVSGCPPQMMDKDVANGHSTGSIELLLLAFHRCFHVFPIDTIPMDALDMNHILLLDPVSRGEFFENSLSWHFKHLRSWQFCGGIRFTWNQLCWPCNAILRLSPSWIEAMMLAAFQMWLDKRFDRQRISCQTMWKVSFCIVCWQGRCTTCIIC